MIQVTAPVEAPETKPKSTFDGIELPTDYMVFDIETGPLPDDVLAKLCPPMESKPHPGKFDPESVKFGNTKDQTKIAEKLRNARHTHDGEVAKYEGGQKIAEAEHFNKFRGDAALSAATGHVVAIGVAAHGCVDILASAMEEETLNLWWTVVKKCLKRNMPMVGFNTKGFDLPFLVRRSWIHNVPIPSGVRVGRYWSEQFIDLMEVWNQGDRGYVKLDMLCAAFGLPGKVTEVDGVEVSGETFHILWETNRKVAEEYLRGDILLPCELARRMQVV